MNKLMLVIMLLMASTSVSNDMSGWKRYEVSAYSHHCIMPKSGIESKKKFKGANGRWPVPNETIAADPRYPFGTVIKLSYRGIISKRVVGDRGRAIKGNRIDLFMESCSKARAWGRKIVYGRPE